ncbi:hypothetical protein T492DRAFT_834425 [Pavlovales sp. CCMP2436]|nr:hypothetical protein T492DRAFT_834425 [Pavlovales sp. CCMP2436]
MWAPTFERKFTTISAVGARSSRTCILPPANDVRDTGVWMRTRLSSTDTSETSPSPYATYSVHAIFKFKGSTQGSRKIRFLEACIVGTYLRKPSRTGSWGKSLPPVRGMPVPTPKGGVPRQLPTKPITPPKDSTLPDSSIPGSSPDIPAGGKAPDAPTAPSPPAETAKVTAKKETKLESKTIAKAGGIALILAGVGILNRDGENIKAQETCKSSCNLGNDMITECGSFYTKENGTLVEVLMMMPPDADPNADTVILNLDSCCTYNCEKKFPNIAGALGLDKFGSLITKILVWGLAIAVIALLSYGAFVLMKIVWPLFFKKPSVAVVIAPTLPPPVSVLASSPFAPVPETAAGTQPSVP